MRINNENDEDVFILGVSRTIYSKEALLVTSYKFTNICLIHIEVFDDDYYAVHLRPKGSTIDLMEKARQFDNELIDQQLRCELNEKSRPIKELIIKKAFFPFDNE